MKNSKHQISLILFAAIFVFISCRDDEDNRIGANATTDTTTNSNASESREEDFVTDVLDMNAREIAWLNAGISKGTDSELKAHAKKMLTDHNTLRSELKDYAQKNNINTPDTDTSNVIDMTDRYGADWDAEWADEVSDDHQRLVNRFERAQRRIKENTALLDIINKALPVLQSHLNTSQQLENKLEKRS
jgi:putative membrane protein